MEAYGLEPAEGVGRGEAMQAVQLEMLRSEEHAHLKEWAAFIVLGDDAPMVFPEGRSSAWRRTGHQRSRQSRL